MRHIFSKLTKSTQFVIVMEGFRPATVDGFLEHVGLSQYAGRLRDQGYESLGDLFLLSQQDLDFVDIKNKDETTSILSAVDSIDINSWLTYYGLSMYERQFREKNVKSVGALKEITITDDALDELEVMVPGHRKRLSIAANQLSFQQQLVAPSQSSEAQSQGMGDALAFGYWARNDSIPTIENDLLWVNCTIKSNKPGHDSVDLECMVDTGSEVVTCKEDLIEHLNLEFLKTIGSKGIHTMVEKSLYRGVLILGGKEVEVEVMPDEYNSVGCNVFRKFNHVIKNGDHIWFG